MPLARVIISCPVTGKDVDTGIVIERRQWETADAHGLESSCVHCEQVHKWDKKDTRLVKIA